MEVGGFRKNFPWTRGGARRKSCNKAGAVSALKELERSWEAREQAKTEVTSVTWRRLVGPYAEAAGSGRRHGGGPLAPGRPAWKVSGVRPGTGSAGKEVRGPLSWSAGAAVTEPAGAALTSHRAGFSGCAGGSPGAEAAGRPSREAVLPRLDRSLLTVSAHGGRAESSLGPLSKATVPIHGRPMLMT